MAYFHTPVLLQEVLDYLIWKKNGIYIDTTTGEGGHSEAICQLLENGSLFCLDRDASIQLIAKERLKNFPFVSFFLANFKDLKKIVEQQNQKNRISGILADLGLSMYHYKNSEKGFSFLKEDKLDMSLDGSHPNAFDVVNYFSEEEISDIIYQYGEEHFSRKIARFIVEYRREKKIETTQELAKIIEKVFPLSWRKKRIHPATKTFQALRIFVNQELENLRILLEDSIEILSPGGRLVVITYHSLEDRIVKYFFKQQEKEGKIKFLSKKPIMPKKEECVKNKSARSAKLRAIEKIG